MANQNTTNVAKNFLNEIHSRQIRDTFEYLTKLIELLENKNDPDPTEIRLVSSLYHFIEHFEILKSNLKSYIGEYSNETSVGNKLHSLWEDESLDINT